MDNYSYLCIKIKVMISKNQIKLIRSLELKKNRKREGLFVAEGPKVVGDLQQAGYHTKMLFSTVARPDAELITEDELRKISFLQHPQEILAVFEIPQTINSKLLTINYMRNILITGANGQLGNCLRDLAADYQDLYQFYYTDVDTLDITDASAVEKYIVDNRIDIILNAAAYTAVDRAEDDQENAYRINCTAVGNLAEAAKRHGLFLVRLRNARETDAFLDRSRSICPPRTDEHHVKI